ncbi:MULTISPECIES: 4'-phosphopantetheinyl transferase superfamily protein [Pseudomonas]|uniref:Enterobactin synthase component D n=1 Tax=Pseudomonas donghuensis TaxID=1163398 RepID=A0AAP0X8D5_9PSED|nr:MULTISPECIES: 4'-phosphopantetheinyl transferase superfamily protein [Pseudomonas]MDF9894900.1 enterobactin synthetase component D [Pseudomonas vranovensis]KDN98016.1 4'-phosphopantetheinyl transferase superfamily protein [Pseudomonas donghuensis]MBF4208382.1 4'-phosphopantetheinyl transferase superfamily protein [Pseudomonas donghuensis]MBS7597360.1 4'-phosphopantetheinyl transferase superfamily protein [Pseudomonas sp. RC2C2]MCP6692923.1 4'-phosphopantetheinyl transferase superfamily prot
MNRLPTCCAPLLHHWPLPRPVPGAILVSCPFDPALLASDDFSRAGIEQTASLQRSVAKRQAEYLAGRVCARAALLQLDGRDYVPGTDEDRAPIWPAGISGSITHGKGWAAAVVARSSDCLGLGLDQESLLSDERAERLAREILTEAEIQRMDPSQIGLTVTLTFSLKESLFKALYPIVRQRFYFEHAEVLEWSADGHARLRLLIDLSAQWHHGRELAGQFCLQDDQLLSLVSV